jgi:hypothetical protein
VCGDRDEEGVGLFDNIEVTNPKSLFFATVPKRGFSGTALKRRKTASLNFCLRRHIPRVLASNRNS